MTIELFIMCRYFENVEWHFERQIAFSKGIQQHGCCAVKPEQISILGLSLVKKVKKK